MNVPVKVLVATAALALAAAALGARAGATRDVTASPVATVATVTTQELRIAVVARRVSAGATPTADVRVGIAVRSGRSWRERRETRLKGPHFWHTVTGPRAICELEVATAGRRGASPYVSVRLLRSPSLGCGPAHRIPLSQRT